MLEQQVAKFEHGLGRPFRILKADRGLVGGACAVLITGLGQRETQIESSNRSSGGVTGLDGTPQM